MPDVFNIRESCQKLSYRNAETNQIAATDDLQIGAQIAGGIHAGKYITEICVPGGKFWSVAGGFRPPFYHGTKAVFSAVRPARFVKRAVRFVNRTMRIVNRAVRFVNRTVRMVNRAVRIVNRAVRFVNRTARIVNRAVRIVNRTARFVNRTLRSANRAGNVRTSSRLPA